MDEFSFPAIAGDTDSLYHLPFPHFTASPLWFVSSVSSPGDDDPIDCHHRRSFSFGEDCSAFSIGSETNKKDELKARSDRGIGRFAKDEDRMDLLWEDFNEELHRAPSGGGRRKGRAAAEGSGRKTYVGRKYDSELYCMMPGSMHRRRSLLMMLRVLKKLFLIQKNDNSKTALYQL